MEEPCTGPLIKSDEQEGLGGAPHRTGRRLWDYKGGPQREGGTQGGGRAWCAEKCAKIGVFL